MKRLFADTHYFIALTAPRDEWRDAALAAEARFANLPIVTTEEVLIEFLNAMSNRGPYQRGLAVAVVEAILEDDAISVVPQSSASFIAGFNLYKRRQDKEYSLVDCISMCAMQEAGITDVLTNDHHFTQEGFTILVRRPEAE